MCSHDEDCEVYGQRLEEYRGILDSFFDNLVDRIIKAKLESASKDEKIKWLRGEKERLEMERAIG